VKVSQGELTLLTGSPDTRDSVRSLWHPGLIAFAVTKGPEGAELFSATAAISVPGFPVTEVDATGCGDSFMAALLAGLLDHGPAPLDAGALQSIGTACCAAGALMATCHGALESMPTRDMISEFLRSRDFDWKTLHTETPGAL
jgi:fructokinase